MKNITYKEETIEISNNKCQENISLAKKKKRNYGIDLARIISMILIINHHIIYHGGPFSKAGYSSILYQLLVCFNLICCAGVNVFGMISGCVGCFTYNYSNLLYLLFLTFFYNICIALLFFFFKSYLIIDLKYFLYPLFITDYWYFNEYFLMYFFLPIINKGIAEINEKTMKYIIINLFLIFSCVGEMKNYNLRFFSIDIFNLKKGFSYIWLLILYLYGSYLGKFKINNNIKRSIFHYIKLVIIIVLAMFIRMKIIVYFIKSPKKKIDLNIDYCSPAEVIISFSIIMIFSNINIKNKYLIKMISFFAPLTYGVYLIHNHLLVRNYIIKNNFQWLTKMKLYNFFIIEILCSFVVFLLCSLIDFIRLLIFNTLKVRQIIIIILKIIKNFIDKICIIDII